MKYGDFVELIKRVPGIYLLNVGMQMETHVHTFKIVLYITYTGEVACYSPMTVNPRIADLTVLGYMNINDIYDDALYCFNDEKYKFEEG